MRTPDLLRKCAGFIGTREGFDLKWRASCFLVAMPSGVPGRRYPYLCTARHVVEKLDGADWAIRFNSRKGPALEIEGTGSRWWVHPTAPDATDFAVRPFTPPEALNVGVLTPSWFATRGVIAERGIGEGDDLFFPGLFTHVVGYERNTPIMRMGNIALITDELIWFDGDLLHAHLIEARSISGMSGSPVFVRETYGIELHAEMVDPSHIPRGRPSMTVNGITDTHWLLGSAIGHWENAQSDHIGISAVVPCDQMLEVLNHPELVEQRQAADSSALGDGSAKRD